MPPGYITPPSSHLAENKCEGQENKLRLTLCGKAYYLRDRIISLDLPKTDTWSSNQNINMNCYVQNTVTTNVYVCNKAEET